MSTRASWGGSDYQKKKKKYMRFEKLHVILIGVGEEDIGHFKRRINDF